MGAEPFLISSTLNVILAQRLVRRLCKEKEKYRLGTSELKDLAQFCDLDSILEILKEEKLVKPKGVLQDVDFYRPKPTEDCPEGYRGRIGIYEVLPVTETIKELIVKRATSSQITAQARKEGMRTMTEEGFVKAARGITSIEEVLRVIIE